MMLLDLVPNYSGWTSLVDFQSTMKCDQIWIEAEWVSHVTVSIHATVLNHAHAPYHVPASTAVEAKAHIKAHISNSMLFTKSLKRLPSFTLGWCWFCPSRTCLECGPIWFGTITEPYRVLRVLIFHPLGSRKIGIVAFTGFSSSA